MSEHGLHHAPCTSPCDVHAMMRIEALLLDLHWSLVGSWRTTDMAHLIDESNRMAREALCPCEQGQSERPEQLRVAAQCSASRQRRLRAKGTRKRLWLQANGYRASDSADDVHQPVGNDKEAKGIHSEQRQTSGEQLGTQMIGSAEPQAQADIVSNEGFEAEVEAMRQSLSASTHAHDDAVNTMRTEIRASHDMVMEYRRMRELCKIEANEDLFRKVLARSAALVGKSKALSVERTDLKEAALAIRDEYVAWKADFKELRTHDKSAVESGVLSADQPTSSTMSSLTARIGIHQRTRPPPPTTKTRRPKAKHKSR